MCPCIGVWPAFTWLITYRFFIRLFPNRHEYAVLRVKDINSSRLQIPRKQEIIGFSGIHFVYAVGISDDTSVSCWIIIEIKSEI